MFWIWMWLGLVACIIALFVVYHFVRANIRRLKRLNEELRAETERFEAHRKKELWDAEQVRKLNHPD
jgi:uncharacterized membrane-anchored protein YhcB (DUF1043 family)